MLGSRSSSSKGTARHSMRQWFQWAGVAGANQAPHRALRCRLHTREAVRHVCSPFACFAEQQADDAFPRVLGDSIVVIDDAEEHQWVNDHLVWRCHQAGKRLQSAHMHRYRQPTMLLMTAWCRSWSSEMGLCTGFFWCI